MDAGVFKSVFARDMLISSTSTPTPRRDAGGHTTPATLLERTPWSPRDADADADAALTRARQECARLTRENAWLRESAAHETDAQGLAWRLRGAEQSVDMQRSVLREVAAFLARAAQPDCNSAQPRSRGTHAQVTWPRVRRTEPCCHDQQVAAEAFRLLRTVQSLLGIAHAPCVASLPAVDELTSSGGHDESGFSSMSSFLDVSPFNASPPNASPLNASPINASPFNASPPNISAINAFPLNASPLNDSHNESYLPESQGSNRFDSLPEDSPTLPSDPPGVGLDDAEFGLPRPPSALPRFRSGLPSRARPQRSLSFSLPRAPGGGAAKLRHNEDFASLRVLWV